MRPTVEVYVHDLEAILDAMRYLAAMCGMTVAEALDEVTSDEHTDDIMADVFGR